MKKYLLTKLHETRNKKKKGFTLVELIVVLVILAILAALLIPALTGYIDNANEKKVTAEARTALMACQTVVSDVYGTEGKAPTGDDLIKKGNTKGKYYDNVAKYAEGYEEGIEEVTVTANKITHMKYTSDNYTAVYKAESGKKGTWTIE